MSGVLLVQRLSLRIDRTHFISKCFLRTGQPAFHDKRASTRDPSNQEASVEVRIFSFYVTVLRAPLLTTFFVIRSALRTVTFSDVDLSLQDKNDLNSLSLSSKSSTASSEYFSAISSDDEDFFDLPTDQEDEGQETPTNDLRATSQPNGDLIQKAVDRLEREVVEDPASKDRREFYRSIDDLMEGQAVHQKKAFEMLKSRENKVFEVLHLQETNSILFLFTV